MAWSDQERIDSAARSLGTLGEIDFPLGSATTYRVGGPAAICVKAETEQDLLKVVNVGKIFDLAILVFGRGSNLLISDQGFEGIAVILSESFGEITINGHEVSAGGAVPLPVLARKTVSEKLSGLEWMVGVPGSVGGAIRMNAGGHGSDTSRSLVVAQIMDMRTGTVHQRTAQQINFGYRSSNVKQSEIVLSARFKCDSDLRGDGQAMLSEIVRWRRENQPGGQNAGSVFVNPENGTSGSLIEEAGLKGLRMGSAFVSPRHANFIQCEPGGSAEDVKALINHVRSRVEKHSQIKLTSEIRFVGFREGS
jgi:UDP-N-acetylmuramate dehydrogenase